LKSRLRREPPPSRKPLDGSCCEYSVRQQIQAVNVDAGMHLYAINPNSCPHLSSASSPASALSSVPATTSASSSLPYVSSWAYSSENSLALGCECRIVYFGFCCAGFGQHGATSWLSSNRKPLSPGIEPAFGYSGTCDRAQRASAGQRMTSICPV